jgi:hypothetical protein
VKAEQADTVRAIGARRYRGDDGRYALRPIVEAPRLMGLAAALVGCPGIEKFGILCSEVAEQIGVDALCRQRAAIALIGLQPAFKSVKTVEQQDGRAFVDAIGCVAGHDDAAFVGVDIDLFGNSGAGCRAQRSSAKAASAARRSIMCIRSFFAIGGRLSAPPLNFHQRRDLRAALRREGQQSLDRHPVERAHRQALSPGDLVLQILYPVHDRPSAGII